MAMSSRQNVLYELTAGLAPVERPVGQPVRDGADRLLTFVLALLAIILVAAYQVLIHLPESWQQRLLGDGGPSE